MDQKHESGEELIDETGRNQTQQRMDAEGVGDKPVVPDDAGGRAKPAAAVPAPEAARPGLLRRLFGRR